LCIQVGVKPTILNNILWIIFLYDSIFSENYRIKASDVFEFLIIALIISVFHILIVVLNGKKYKIGAILATVFTGHLVICIFYYGNL